jgi:hypothetical protein
VPFQNKKKKKWVERRWEHKGGSIW